jgi:hypothetical protein
VICVVLNDVAEWGVLLLVAVVRDYSFMTVPLFCALSSLWFMVIATDNLFHRLFAVLVASDFFFPVLENISAHSVDSWGVVCFLLFVLVFGQIVVDGFIIIVLDVDEFELLYSSNDISSSLLLFVFCLLYMRVL